MRLALVHPDVAALRRYLVDARLMSRVERGLSAHDVGMPRLQAKSFAQPDDVRSMPKAPDRDGPPRRGDRRALQLRPGLALVHRRPARWSAPRAA